MKKINIFSCVIFILSTVSSNAYSYSSAELESANYLAQKNIIVNHDTSPSEYNLDENVLRQEIAAVARGISGLEKKESCDNLFKDISSVLPNNWVCGSVEILADNGLIATNEYFRPEEYISKTEALGMIIKSAYGDEYEYDMNSSTTWQEQIVQFAVNLGIVEKFLDYDEKATRGFVFLAAKNAMESLVTSQVSNYVPNNTLEFDPIIGSSSNFIPFPSENVLFIDFQIKNPTDKDIYITEIHANIINSTGLGIGEFSNLKVYKDDVVMTFANNFDFTDVNAIIKANSAAVFMIRGDISEYVVDQTTFDLEISGTDIKAFYVNGDEIFFEDGAVMNKKFILYKNEKQPKTENE